MSVDLEPCVSSPSTRQSTSPSTTRRSVTLHSSTFQVQLLDPLALFEAGHMRDATCCYWEQPAEDLVMVGIGAAHQMDVRGPGRFREAQRTWARLCDGAAIEGEAVGGPRLLGGFAFDADSAARGLWDGFPSGRLTLPRLLYTVQGGEAALTCNVLLPASAAAGHARQALADEWAALSALARRQSEGRHPATEVAGYLLPSPASRATTKSACTDFARVGAPSIASQPAIATAESLAGIPRTATEELPDAAAWKALVAEATRAMRVEGGARHEEPLQKVVLARAARIRSREPFEPVAVLRRLRAGGSSRFLFAFAVGEQCFLGATPERLARLEAGRVETAAVAGSRRRGATGDEDAALAADLLRSAKDRWEHALVAQEVARALRAAGVDVPVIPEPRVLRLPTVQHLCTPFVGSIRDGTTILDLVERLHPTPAVGGAPRQVALDWLRANEGLDRGWYTGPVGWLDADGNGDFAVGIRSALLSGAEATLFAGCGIVADSDPDAEYEESWLKLRPMLAALGSYG